MMLGAKELFVTSKRTLRQFERLAGTPAGDQREGQPAAQPIRLRVVGAKAADCAL